MLDYAANMLGQWSVDRILSEFEHRCLKQGIDPVDALTSFLGTGDLAEGPERFWERVKDNLQHRRLRLVFVADHIPDSLRTIVEFLNEQMVATEVLAVQIKQHTGAGVTALVSEVVGSTPSARQVKRAAGKTWDEETFLELVSRGGGAPAIGAADAVLRWAEARDSVRLAWGAGAVEAAVFMLVGGEDLAARAFGLSATDRGARFHVYPQGLRKIPSLSTEVELSGLLARFQAIPETGITGDLIGRTYLSFPLQVLTQENLPQLIGILDEAVRRAKVG